MREAPFQIYPPGRERALRRILLWLGFVAGCMVLGLVLCLYATYLGPVGLVLFEPVTGGNPGGWPLAWVERGLSTEYSHELYFLLDNLFYTLLVAPICYLAVRKALGRGEDGPGV